MAERRMFAKTIIDSDAFLDMPLSTQALYFHLSMRADDDGFLNNAKRIMRSIGANQNDYDLLIVKKFIIQFDDGICVIKHWRIHNYIQSDRYNETNYKKEKGMLYLKDNKAYTLDTTEKKMVGNKIIEVKEEQKNECIQDVCIEDTQVRLGKDRLGKDSIDIDIDIDNSISKDILSSADAQLIITKWNELGLQKLSSINPGSKRRTSVKARIKEVGLDKFIEAIESVKQSSFLRGQNNRNWTITFDWLIKPNNFTKVLEGNYDDKGVGLNGSVGGNNKPTFEIKKNRYTNIDDSGLI